MKTFAICFLALLIYQSESLGSVNDSNLWSDFEDSIHEYTETQNIIEIYQVSEMNVKNEALFFIRIYDNNTDEIIFEDELVLPLELAINLQDGNPESIQYLLEWDELIINEARSLNSMSSEGQEKMQFAFLNREDKIKRECDAGRYEVCSSVSGDGEEAYRYTKKGCEKGKHPHACQELKILEEQRQLK